jgi:hypothetical protein
MITSSVVKLRNPIAHHLPGWKVQNYTIKSWICSVFMWTKLYWLFRFLQNPGLTMQRDDH